MHTNVNEKALNYCFKVIAAVSVIFLNVGVAYNLAVLEMIGRSSIIQTFYSVADSQSYVFLLTFVIPMLVFPFFGGFLIDLSLGLR